MGLSHYVETLSLLGDESRIRLCALLAERELCVTDLVKVTGISQSRVSTHLGRLREAGLVRDRKHGTQCFYGLVADELPGSVRGVLDEAARSEDPTLLGDKKRLAELEAERREGLPESAADQIERDYSPGRSWRTLALGTAALLELGDVLDVGSGDGAAASALAPYCKSLTCIDVSARLIETAAARLAKYPHAEAKVADVHALPFSAASFDAVLMFHTLTYAEQPARALAECARVLRPGGRLVVLCLAPHDQHEVTARYGELHAGFSPRKVRGLLTSAGLEVISSELACREAKKPHLEVVLAIAVQRAKR
ncbi:MAG TPA: metalloregulator ArsR/SmtB family transcription factor [Polyangiales bacterium]|jgi:ArsR family transcriptional regulator|nr:metalloregulator ArsR/SmtB family transcription factor [Polyangiales bacterium]